jgi:hypothetical protein
MCVGNQTSQHIWVGFLHEFLRTHHALEDHQVWSATALVFLSNNPEYRFKKYAYRIMTVWEEKERWTPAACVYFHVRKVVIRSYTRCLSLPHYPGYGESTDSLWHGWGSPSSLLQICRKSGLAIIWLYKAYKLYSIQLALIRYLIMYKASKPAKRSCGIKAYIAVCTQALEHFCNIRLLYRWTYLALLRVIKLSQPSKGLCAVAYFVWRYVCSTGPGCSF